MFTFYRSLPPTKLIRTKRFENRSTHYYPTVWNSGLSIFVSLYCTTVTLKGWLFLRLHPYLKNKLKFIISSLRVNPQLLASGGILQFCVDPATLICCPFVALYSCNIWVRVNRTMSAGISL